MLKPNTIKLLIRDETNFPCSYLPRLLLGKHDFCTESRNQILSKLLIRHETNFPYPYSPCLLSDNHDHFPRNQILIKEMKKKERKKTYFTILEVTWHKAGWEHRHRPWQWHCGKPSTTIWHSWKQWLEASHRLPSALLSLPLSYLEPCFASC